MAQSEWFFDGRRLFPVRVVAVTTARLGTRYAVSVKCFGVVRWEIPGQGVHIGSLTMMPKASVCQEERPDRRPKANPYGRVWGCIALGWRRKKEACSVLSDIHRNV